MKQRHQVVIVGGQLYTVFNLVQAPGLKLIEDTVRIRRKVLLALEFAEKELFSGPRTT